MALFLSKWFVLVSTLLATKGLTSETSKPGNFHPFYVSVTEINLNSQEKSIEISCKFFADDFEKTLEKTSKTELDVSSGKDKASLDKLIPDYISRHFNLSVEDKAVHLNYVGFEKDKESVYCYFEVPHSASAKRLTVTNNFLYELTHDQINIMHVTVNGQRQSTKLGYPDVKADFKF